MFSSHDLAPDEDTLAGKGQMTPRDGIAVP
jgi:hypothetical protein